MSIIKNELFEQNRTLFFDCYKHWDKESQLIVAIEEMSELTKEICKELRGIDAYEGLLEEVVDVLIMINQLIITMNFPEGSFNEILRYKLKKISNRLESEE